jgi:hypothetical protein
MTVKELIKKLEEMPQDMQINIFDWRKNLFIGDGDSVSDGIESVEHIEIVPDNETTHLMQEDGDKISQWVAIIYNNNDYNEGGEKSFPKPKNQTPIAEFLGDKINYEELKKFGKFLIYDYNGDFVDENDVKTALTEFLKSK